MDSSTEVLLAKVLHAPCDEVDGDHVTRARRTQAPNLTVAGITPLSSPFPGVKSHPTLDTSHDRPT
jgi:hypothetical protein